MTQRDMILKYLQEHVGIDTLIAEEEFACRRLAARIAELRERGYIILSFPKTVYNRFGQKCRVSEYRLLKEGEAYESREV